MFKRNSPQRRGGGRASAFDQSLKSFLQCVVDQFRHECDQTKCGNTYYKRDRIANPQAQPERGIEPGHNEEADQH